MEIQNDQLELPSDIEAKLREVLTGDMRRAIFELLVDSPIPLDANTLYTKAGGGRAESLRVLIVSGLVDKLSKRDLPINKGVTPFYVLAAGLMQYRSAMKAWLQTPVTDIYIPQKRNPIPENQD